MDTLDYIVKKYGLTLWKAPTPIEIPDTDRHTLAALFAELGYTTGAEIGVEGGMYSRALCRANPKLRLHCIDPWISDGVYRKQLDQAYVDGLLATCLKRLRGYNCNIIRKTSMDAVKDFEDNSLDFVYIDGNHRFEFVVNDMAEWTKKVRPGGIVSGHDWIRLAHSSEVINNDPIHVQYAVPAFCAAYRIKPWFILGTYGVNPGEKRDRVRSWFWVKQ